MKKQETVQFSTSEIDTVSGQTNWNKFDSIAEEDLEKSIKDDADDVYLSDEELANGEWIENVENQLGKQLISIRVDTDVLDFFKRQGKGYQSRMNQVLRSFVNAKSNG